jgi:alkylation response protein AidB-like acyl-CoA dehydrogenase
MTEPEELGEFRLEVRGWASHHVPRGWRDDLRGADHATLGRFLRAWSLELKQGGWLVPHWPKEWGGGFSVPQQVVIAEELVRADAPRNSLFHVALYNAAPAIIHQGTDAQKQRFLTGILNGEVWCQGFSEPDAGSDLAGLKTRAVRVDDHYVVTGQKVWTSTALEADWCFALVRTDPDAPKHRGLSILIVDMRSPGVEVRRIVQVTGADEFCETFFDEVEVPIDNVVGAENDGWKVAQGTLASERAVVILEMAERLRRNGIEAMISDAATFLVDGSTPLVSDSAARELLAERYAEAVVLGNLVDAQIASIIHGNSVPAESSIIKLFYSELLQRTMRDATNLQGVSGQVRQPLLEAAGWESGDWMSDYLNSWGWTISGGTNEIMRNMIGEQLLGLPREPKPQGI